MECLCDDIALAVVEVDEKDKYFKKHAPLLNRIKIPPPLFFDQGDEDDITGIGNHSDTVKRREDSMLALSGAQGTYLEYHQIQ